LQNSIAKPSQYHCLSVDILAQLKERRDTYFVVSIECDRIPGFPTRSVSGMSGCMLEPRASHSRLTHSGVSKDGSSDELLGSPRKRIGGGEWAQ